jgi:hypothetical protein
MPAKAPTQEAVDTARQELASCVLSSSYKYCLGAVALAVPIGVVTKSYSPLAYAGLGGTALDLLNGYNSCTEQREALRVALEAAEASRS